MIDGEATFKEFGYTSDSLSHGSKKRVCVVCDKCNRTRTLAYGDFLNLKGYGCKKCLHNVISPISVNDFIYKSKLFTTDINENRTMEEFGYYSIDLKLGSSKYIYRVCIKCGAEKLLRYSDYNRSSHLCHSCAASINHADVSGEKNPMFGKQSALVSGERNPNFNGWSSLKIYPKEFYNKRDTIRDAADNRCEICGKSSIENGVKLSIHHIDRDKKNNIKSNLIALCISCHSKSHNTVTQSHLEYIKSLETYKWN